MGNKKSTTIESAKIAMYGTIIVAFIGIVTAAINSYSNYMSNRVQIELPIVATQTAEARILKETQEAPPSVSESTISFASVIIQNLVNRSLLTTNSGTVVWEEKESRITVDNIDSAGAVSTNFAPQNFVFFSNVAWNSDDTELTACGFNFRSNSLRSDYTTILRKNGSVFLWLTTASGAEGLLSAPIKGMFTRENNETNNLLLIVEGSNFIFLVNDAVAYNTSDQTLTTGFVGKVVGSGSKDTNICTFSNSWLWAIK